MSRARYSVQSPVGLVTAARLLDTTPDPPGLQNIRAKNAKHLRRLAKLVHIMCLGRTGQQFFLGTEALGMALGVSQQTAYNRLKQLVRLNVLRCDFEGGLCIRDPDGRPYRHARIVRNADDTVVSTYRMAQRAAEYTFLGLPGRDSLYQS